MRKTDNFAVLISLLLIQFYSLCVNEICLPSIPEHNNSVYQQQSVLHTGKPRHSKRLCTLCNGSITNMGGSVPPTNKLVCKAIKLHSSEEAPVLCWMSSSLTEVLGQINKRGDWSCLDTA